MKVLSRVGAGVVMLSALVFAPATVGRTPLGDSVETRGEPTTPVAFQITARSGPRGEEPTGEFFLRTSGDDWDGSVSCLGVTNDIATIGFTGVHTYFGWKLPTTGLLQILDRRSGKSPDRIYMTFETRGELFMPPPPALPGPTDCSAFPGPFGGPSLNFSSWEMPNGMLAVVDAPVTPRPVLLGDAGRRLHPTLARGIQMKVRCYAPCRFRAVLRLAGNRARALGLTRRRRAVVIASASDELSANETRVIALTFTSRARRHLAGADRLKLKLAAEVRSVRGDSRLRRAISLRSGGR